MSRLTRSDLYVLQASRGGYPRADLSLIRSVKGRRPRDVFAGSLGKLLAKPGAKRYRDTGPISEIHVLQKTERQIFSHTGLMDGCAKRIDLPPSRLKEIWHEIL